ncbi:hypothetical protein ACRYI5_08190 [Furfurilactobacillus sp. WILCCON 0119]|uniref:hypothetical protein n=1 Tax=Furfurilactobacillus entadae TaxID=2922307 RepID=UPI0035E4D711
MINYKSEVEAPELAKTLDFLARQQKISTLTRQSSVNLRELLLIQLIFTTPDLEISMYAKKLSTSISFVSMMMTNFVQRNLVKVSGERYDRRRKTVRLTSQGVLYAHETADILSQIGSILLEEA